MTIDEAKAIIANEVRAKLSQDHGTSDPALRAASCLASCRDLFTDFPRPFNSTADFDSTVLGFVTDQI